MDNPPPIRVAGSEATNDPSSPPRWGAVVAGVAVGVALGVLVASAGTPIIEESGERGAEVPSPAPTPTSAAPASPRASDRLATLVPGLVDSLVVVAADMVGTSQVAVWRATDQTPSTERLPARQVEADAVHRWLAVLSPARLTEGQVLWVGDDGALEPIDTGVESALWHASLPGRLSWVLEGSSGRRVMISDLSRRNAGPGELFTLDEGQAPVWWHQAGMVVLDSPTDTLRLVDGRGFERARLEEVGAFLAGGHGVGVVLDGNREALLVDERLQVLRPTPWEAGCGEVSFAPSATGEGEQMVAVVCGSVPDRNQRIQVWNVSQGGDELVAELVSSETLPPTWTPDGRFLVIPRIDPLRATTEIVFMEVSSEKTYPVNYPGRAFDVETTRS